MVTELATASSHSPGGAVGLALALLCSGWIVVTTALALSVRRPRATPTTSDALPPDPRRARPANRPQDRLVSSDASGPLNDDVVAYGTSGRLTQTPAAKVRGGEPAHP